MQGMLSRRVVPHEKSLSLFPGQGAQSLGMGRLLFEELPAFRDSIEAADELVRPVLHDGLISLIYPPQESPEALRQLNQTSIAQPAIFAVSYALARVWSSLGVQPGLLIGHSIGEFVAATLAGTLSFEDALRLVVARGAVMQQLPAGAMLAVRAGAEAVLPYLGDTLDLASVNGPKSVVVSGSHAQIEDLASRLSQNSIAARKLATSHAFHSRMMDAAAEPLCPLSCGCFLSPANHALDLDSDRRFDCR